MIDKKPFMVTNEQAAQVLNATLITDISPEYLKKYASDLLDARELIDKQESIIKEMRSRLIESRMELEEYEQCKTGESYNNPFLNVAIEKTKDYA